MVQWIRPVGALLRRPGGNAAQPPGPVIWSGELNNAASDAGKGSVLARLMLAAGLAVFAVLVHGSLLRAIGMIVLVLVGTGVLR